MLLVNRIVAALMVVVGGVLTGCSASVDIAADPSWQQEFDLDACDLATKGSSEFFVLEPGFRLLLEGNNEKLLITVLDETRTIAGTPTRVVEEREWRDDALIEVSRNFFAFCPETSDAYYFGEEVDDYKDGEISGHGGAWLAGLDEARPGMIMPGDPQVGMKYYQEIAPNVALDRAEIVSLDETLATPAATFTDCLRTQEGTALNLNEREFKTYAPGIGLIQDQGLLLTDYGFDVSL